MIDFPKGIITAAVTPMNSDLNCDKALLIAHCRQLLSQGSDGIVLLGTTGEANSFSLAERKDILEGIIKGDIPQELLMVGTGCCSISDTIELTKHAVAHDVKNVLMLPPFYYKPVSDTALFRYYADVVERVGDDSLRVYLYHIPKNTGIDLSMNLLAKLIKYYPNVIAGIKDSGGDWQHMQQIMKEFPGFSLYCGTEVFLLDTLKAGGAGSISATANVTISSIADIVRAYRDKKDASSFQFTATQLRGVFNGLPFVGALKGVLAYESKNPAWNYLRPPNEIIEPDIINRLIQDLNVVLNPV